jgi:Methyltransferase domain
MLKRYQQAMRFLRGEALYVRGYRFAGRFEDRQSPTASDIPSNPLAAYFDAHIAGPGLWKWRHYFDIYDRHLAKFRGREVHVVEIGVYSGGSIQMWHDYFGPSCLFYGVDIESACKAYETDKTRIFIGDQADPAFWADFIHQVPRVDVVLDDGGHEAHQQIETLEALLAHLRPGGVFLCEDSHGRGHPFHAYVAGLSRQLHAMTLRDAVSDALPFQRSIEAISLYPFVTVIEKRQAPLEVLELQKHGTEWQPFYDHQ